jgi:REP element-mobilizing transposase RayT
MQKNHNRHSTRLKGYDYTQAGGYFVTICTKEWVHLFGDIQNGEMIINNLGRIVQHQWLDLPKHYAGVELDDFIVMPNHFHGVIIINGIVTTKRNLVGAGLKPAPTNTKNHGLPELIRAFKTFSARKINKVNGNQAPTIWQRGYFDRVIRNVSELDRIREYIRANPENYGNEDSFY